MEDNIEAVAEWLYNYAVKLSGRPDWYDSWAECKEDIKEDFRSHARQIDTLCQKRIEQVGKRLRDYQKTGFVWAQELERITRDCEAKEVSNG